MKQWIYNPKTKGSGIITCIPQKEKCPNKCPDCFFQSGRSYLEPLEKNLPHIPSRELSKNRIVRMNDGNDSNFQRELVQQVAENYKHYFYNTAIPINLEGFKNPVVLTINPGPKTDRSFFKLNTIPKNLMFVRVRTNLCNIDKVVKPAVDFYTKKEVKVVLTFLAYYTNKIPSFYLYCKRYIWKKRTVNSYFCLSQEEIDKIMEIFKDNPYVYSCGVKDTHSCSFCGNCIREYYNTLERIRE